MCTRYHYHNYARDTDNRRIGDTMLTVVHGGYSDSMCECVALLIWLYRLECRVLM